MTPARALSFDLDDTLRDASGRAGALRRTAQQLSLLSGLPTDALLDANRTAWADLWPQIESAWTLGAMRGEEVTTEAWRRALAACGLDDPELVRRATETHLAELLHAERLYDDALPLLSQLDGVLPMALITNGASDTQRAVLRALDLERRFNAIVISGEAGVAKPDAAAFALACEALGAEPATTWHVGDNLVTDVGGAKAAGLVAVWLDRDRVGLPSDAVEPDLTITSLEALLPHLASADALGRGQTQ